MLLNEHIRHRFDSRAVRNPVGKHVVVADRPLAVAVARLENLRRNLAVRDHLLLLQVADGHKLVPSLLDARHVRELVGVEDRTSAELDDLERHVRILDAVALHPARIAALLELVEALAARVVLREAVGRVEDDAVVDELPDGIDAAHERLRELALVFRLEVAFNVVDVVDVARHVIVAGLARRTAHQALRLREHLVLVRGRVLPGGGMPRIGAAVRIGCREDVDVVVARDAESPHPAHLVRDPPLPRAPLADPVAGPAEVKAVPRPAPVRLLGDRAFVEVGTHPVDLGVRHMEHHQEPEVLRAAHEPFESILAAEGRFDREVVGQASVVTARVPAGGDERGDVAGGLIRAVVDGKEIHVCNGNGLAYAGIAYEPVEEPGTIVYVASDGHCIGSMVISDRIKEDSEKAFREIKACGVRKTVMLTGDSKSAATEIAAKLGIDEVYSELLPADKVNVVEKLLAELSEKEKLVFVGDGVNDAPVLARADIGIAMGALGSDAAIEAADVVFMDDKPSKLATAIKLARRTISIARQNIIFAIAVKVIVLILTALGYATMWAAVFADVGVALICIISSLRNMKKI